MRGIVTVLILLCTIPRTVAQNSAQNVPAEVAVHAAAAKEAESRNDFPKAVEQYSLVVKAMPSSAEMQSNLGVVLYFAGDKQRSLEVFERAMQIDPNLLVPHLFSGFALFQLSQPARSAQQLERAIHLRGGDPMAHLWLGYAYLSLGKVSEATSQLQIASNLKPDDPDVWYALGQAYLRAGQEATEKLLSVSADGGRLWQLTAEQYLMRGDRTEAVKLFEGAAERRPDLADVRQSITQLGGSIPASTRVESPAQRSTEDRLYHQAHEDESKAEAAFGRISQIAPDSYRAHQVMGNAFAAQGQSDEAIKEYRAALAMKPDLPELHAAIGNNLLRVAKPQEALEEFREELALQPFSASACEGVGRVLVSLGRDDEASEVLNRALKLDRPPLETYRLLGKIELRRRNYPKAIELLTHYVTQDPGDSTTWYLLAGAYRGSGATARMNEAIEHYKQTSLDTKQRAHAQMEYKKLGQDRAEVSTEEQLP